MAKYCSRCPNGHSWCDGGDWCVSSRHKLLLQALEDEWNAENRGDLITGCCCEVKKFEECPLCEIHGGSIHDHSEYCKVHKGI